MFKEVPAQFDFPTEENKTLDFWDANAIYHKSLEQRRDAKPFVFYEGPPTANGLPHPGHCLTRAIKDLFPRYKTMTGHYCHRRAGWDTHGLPVETEVCKELGIHSKEEIEKFGMEPFIHKCVESVFRYTKEWEDVTRRLGFWVDTDEAYVTYHQSYVESVWWALKSFFDADLLYRGNKIVWWWAQGGTGLSAGEVGQGYREVDDPSVFVRFPLLDAENTSLLVWTTTPWTLPSNTFAAVHPEIEYALVADAESGEQLYVAAALIEGIAAKGKRELSVVSTCKGADLVGRRYQPPFNYYHESLGETKSELAAGGDEYVAWRVLAADFVTTDSGTGLVHQAPAFGEVDYEVLQAERERFRDPEAVPLLCAVRPDGTFGDDVDPKFRGRWVKEADKDLARELKERGLLYHLEQYRHDYPFCWRASEDPLIQYPRESWFIRTTRFVDDMLANNSEMNWLPKHIQDGRFGKFLENNVDWSLSRERYWGTPLPIWVCEKTGHMEAIGSYAELLEKPGMEGTDVWDKAKAENPDLIDDLKVHRPYIDAVTYASPKDPSARMRRVPEVIDCWFDSGSMPFAQLGFPQKNQDRFAREFPADFISEALDQTRGWFYSLLAISTLLFGKNGVAAQHGGVADTESVAADWPQPFRNCIVLGLLLGEDGTKMSKSLKNYKTPDYIFDEEGADAMRWLFFSGQAPWTSIRFQEKAIEEGQREYLIRLYNVYSFFVIYANIDGWTPTGGLCGELPDLTVNELDQWIIAELHATIRDVRADLDRFDNFPAARRLSGFVDALSNWYVRRSRDRFWRSGMDADKAAAYGTLYHCLVNMALLTAPFTPFIAESLYQNLVKSRTDADFPESVHLCDYPVLEEALICDDLAAEMVAVREIVSLGRAVRAQAKLRVRLPLPQVEVVLADTTLASRLAHCTALISEELNVKSVEFIQQADEYVDYQVKPNFRSIGPRFGKLAPAIQKELKGIADAAALLHELEENGKVTLEVNGEKVELTGDDVQVELTAKDGWAAAQGRSSVVVLKTEVTPELLREGMGRELVHHVQQLRKELDLAYEQRITLSVHSDAEELVAAIDEHRDHIVGETLADELQLTADLPGVGTRKEVTIEGHAAVIEVAGK